LTPSLFIPHPAHSPFHPPPLQPLILSSSPRTPPPPPPPLRRVASSLSSLSCSYLENRHPVSISTPPLHPPPMRAHFTPCPSTATLSARARARVSADEHSPRRTALMPPSVSARSCSLPRHVASSSRQSLGEPLVEASLSPLDSQISRTHVPVRSVFISLGRRTQQAAVTPAACALVQEGARRRLAPRGASSLGTTWRRISSHGRIGCERSPGRRPPRTDSHLAPPGAATARHALAWHLGLRRPSRLRSCTAPRADHVRDASTIQA
jgi:hypothetical protein